MWVWDVVLCSRSGMHVLNERIRSQPDCYGESATYCGLTFDSVLSYRETQQFIRGPIYLEGAEPSKMIVLSLDDLARGRVLGR